MLLKASDSKAYQSLIGDYESGVLQYSVLKDKVADALISLVSPIQEEKKKLMANKKEIKQLIKKSSAEIRKRAAQTVSDVKVLTGIG
jgi:tryptophanyl-tRNA synthetase